MDILPNVILKPIRVAGSVLLTLLMVVAMAAPHAAASARGTQTEPPPQRDTLLNGLRLVTISRPSNRISVVCAVRAGAMFDPAGKSGLANVTAGLLTMGAGSYTGDRIRGDLDDAGVAISIDTDWDATWIKAEGPPASLPLIFEMLGLMVSVPRFADADVEAIKRAATDRVTGDASDGEAIAERRFANALYGSHTYGRSVWGSASEIAAISAGDVKFFHDRLYSANTSVVSVCGPVTAESVTTLARSHFGRWQKKNVVPATFIPPASVGATKVFVVDAPGVGEPVVRAGFMAPGRSEANVASVKVLAERLERDLAGRIPGATNVTVRHDLRVLDSPFVVGLSVPVDRVERSIAGIVDGIAALKNGAMASGASRIYFTKSVDTCAESARIHAAAEFYAGQRLAADPVDYKVDEGQLGTTARTVLKPEALTVVVVGPSEAIEKALKGKFQIEVVTGT